jgi:hypothetical protein
MIIGASYDKVKKGRDTDKRGLDGVGVQVLHLKITCTFNVFLKKMG